MFVIVCECTQRIQGTRVPSSNSLSNLLPLHIDDHVKLVYVNGIFGATGGSDTEVLERKEVVLKLVHVNWIFDATEGFDTAFLERKQIFLKIQRFS